MSVGLAVVHWFAFRVSARLVASGRYAIARGGGGATRARALLYALTVLVVAVAIAELKNRLAGH